MTMPGGEIVRVRLTVPPAPPVFPRSDAMDFHGWAQYPSPCVTDATRLTPAEFELLPVTHDPHSIGLQAYVRHRALVVFAGQWASKWCERPRWAVVELQRQMGNPVIFWSPVVIVAPRP